MGFEQMFEKRNMFVVKEILKKVREL